MISIIMSVYNAEKYLKESLESILSQTYKNFEFIIVEDCSSDSSLNILKEYAMQDQRIILIENKRNLGLTKNLNKAIKISKRKYIARMDADDISEKNRLEEQIKFLENNHEIDILGTFSKNINELGEVIGRRKAPIKHEDILKLLPKVNPIAHPTVMFRKSSLKQIGGYNEAYRKCQDYELWFRAASFGLKMHNIPNFLMKYRMNDNYVTRKSWEYRKTDIKIRLKGYKELRLSHPKYIYLLIPIILACMPSSFYSLLKKLDPR